MAEKPIRKIFLVDDEEDVLAHLSRIIKRANYDVVATSRAREVVELAAKQLPDLIIMDINMPDMRGTEASVLLSDNPATSNIPIIFLTGLLSKESESLEKTPDKKRYVMLKPATGKEVLEAIKKVLSG